MKKDNRESFTKCEVEVQECLRGADRILLHHTREMREIGGMQALRVSHVLIGQVAVALASVRNAQRIEWQLDDIRSILIKKLTPR